MSGEKPGVRLHAADPFAADPHPPVGPREDAHARGTAPRPEAEAAPEAGTAHGADEPQGAARTEEAEAARARAATAAGRMPGTTHDPNSVTTMTDAEPKGDVYPPPGTDER